MKINQSVAAADALKVLEAALQVEERAGRVEIKFRSLIDPTRYLAVNVPSATWREFCQHWVDQPKGGAA